MRPIDADKYEYPGDLINEPTLTYDDIVPHGQWIEDEKGEVICSECGIRIPEMNSNADTIIKSECRSCHSCGVKMDGEE